ncbi:hypothetical protein [Paenibacillus prosopidis]|uniref:Uncharacterized protein n=1 Tax=Paenibacillus prosopidis TaxID=630520 RepID=A0A368W5X4_9BACL|nr:hypothetical protein [Paenibacillus prosopidis]RCW50894.1 hypothetical protein DFP97_10286 [Paenibacillus prosopidis]
MSIPIMFLHWTDNDYLAYTLRQAKISSPASDVILIGTDINNKYCGDGIHHVQMHNYYHGAAEFERVYKHLTPNEYVYNRFCFQRWFVLRDFMKTHHFTECWVLDTDIMLYTDLSNPKYKCFSGEWTWTTYITLKELEELCTVTHIHFQEDNLFEYLKYFTKQKDAYSRTHEGYAISDMVTQTLYYDNYLLRDRMYGVFEDSFFDNELFSAHPGVETLDNKKKIYLINGNLMCRRSDNGQFIKAITIHFTQSVNKKYIPHFYGPNLSPYNYGSYYFDYTSCQWIPTSL